MPVVPSLDVEKYLDFKEMTSYLRDVGKAAPHLVRVFSIGKSREGRPLLVAEVTNRNLKKGREKPGLWIDGGHQGWNLLGTTACLELLRFLVSGHGRDEFLTDLVDHNVFYIAPRMAPDEMEVCLATGAIMPVAPERGGSLVVPMGQQFRQESPLGGWTPYKRDNRMLVKRQPEDRKGPFYDLYRHLDGTRLAAMEVRDFPSHQSDLPAERVLEVPSSRAIFEFMRSYGNIFSVISASGPGDVLRMQVGDGEQSWYRGLGLRLGELSGLPCQVEPIKSDRAGSFLTWVVEALGLFSIDCRMWSLRTAAGLKDEPFVGDPLTCEETDTLQVLRFCEKEFPEGSFRLWNTIEDPELGAGELGGWDWSRTWLNPPAGPYLARELKRFSRLVLGLASAGPRLVIAEVSERMLGWSSGDTGRSEPLRHLSVRIENRGYLPTYPIKRLSSTGAQLTAQCVRGEGALLIGSASTPLEDLQGTGFAELDDGLPYASTYGRFKAERSTKREFLFQGQAEIEIVVTHPMAGTDKVLSRPTQIMKPPVTHQNLAASTPFSQIVESSEPQGFEDAFPSFEELYQDEEEDAPESGLPPRPLAPTLGSPLVITRPLAPSPAPVQVTVDPHDEFGIPMPAVSGETSISRKVEFPSFGVEGGSTVSPEPFPKVKAGRGRVLGSPPQKPGALPGQGGSTSASGSRPVPEESFDPGDFSPLPFVKSSAADFEPLAPSGLSEPADHPFTAMKPPHRAEPTRDPTDDRPSAPPPRMSRVSAPQLLRRQRGAQGPPDPFNR